MLHLVKSEARTQHGGVQQKPKLSMLEKGRDAPRTSHIEKILAVLQSTALLARTVDRVLIEVVNTFFCKMFCLLRLLRAPRFKFLAQFHILHL